MCPEEEEEEAVEPLITKARTNKDVSSDMSGGVGLLIVSRNYLFHLQKEITEQKNKF